MLKYVCACVACCLCICVVYTQHFLGTVTCLVRQGFQHFMQLSVVPISPGICLSLPPQFWNYKHRTFVFSIQFYVYEYFACLYVCVTCGYRVGRGQKRVWGPLEIYIYNYIVIQLYISPWGAGTQTLVLWMNSQYSQPLSQLSKPMPMLFYMRSGAGIRGIGCVFFPALTEKF